MTINQLALILCTVFALATGQILFKLTSSTLILDPKNILSNLLNWRLILALSVYAIATIMWLVVLRTTPLRVAYPFVALAFIIVPVLAHYLLGEQLTWRTFAGAALIGLGVCVSVL